MYRAGPKNEAPNVQFDENIGKDLINKIDAYDTKMLSYLAKLYKAMTGNKMDFDNIQTAIEALQEYNGTSEYYYLNNLLYPEKNKGSKIPSPIPVPSCAFQLHNSISLSTNSLGNLALVFNPVFLYSNSMLKPYTTNNQDPDYASFTPSFFTSLFVNNDDTLTGSTPNSNFKPVNIGQGLPDVYDQYRLVSASIVVKYIGRLDHTSGVIGGAIVFDEIPYLGTKGTYNGGNENYQACDKFAKYGNFDLAMDSFYTQENMTINGIRELYFPIDNSFEEYVNLNLSTGDSFKLDCRTTSAAILDATAPSDYYKSGFNYMIYVLGAPASNTCFKVDVYMNFECLPNASYLNYLPISPPAPGISATNKGYAIKEVQQNSIGKPAEESKNNKPPSIWSRMKEKFGNALPGITKILNSPLLGMVPGIGQIAKVASNVTSELGMLLD